MSIEETIREIVREEVTKAMNDLLERLTKKEEESEYITRFEKAKQLKVSLATLNNWDRNGLLVPVRVGRKVFYKRDDFGKYSGKK